ncbi:unnamed protein product [Arctogadus glacialis]
MSGMEEAGEQPSLKRCTSSIISGEVAWQQIHHTDDSFSSDKARRVSSSRVMIAKSSGSAQPADLCPTNSTLPISTLYGPVCLCVSQCNHVLHPTYAPVRLHGEPPTEGGGGGCAWQRVGLTRDLIQGDNLQDGPSARG